VAAAVDISTLVASDRTLRPVGDGIVSALAPEDAGAPYDRKRRVHRWGVPPCHPTAGARGSLDRDARASRHALEGAPVSLVQAICSSFRFATVGCLGLLHVLDDPWAALVTLREQMAPGGRMFASMLVAERPVGRRYLAALHRAGEVSRPRRAHELKAAAESVFGLQAEVRCTGSTAWLRASVR
jgi:hypothetical protein